VVEIKNICISCGFLIKEESDSSPEICRDCELMSLDEESMYV